MEAYARTARPAALPVTEDVTERILCLPSGFADAVVTVERIVGLIREARAEAGAIRRKEGASA